MTNIEFWYHGPLKEAWQRYQVAGATDAVARYDTVALGRSKGIGSDCSTSDSQEQGLASTSSSAALAGCNPGSPGAFLFDRPKESLERLVSIWMTLDGTALTLLEPLGRLMADMAAACERMAGPNPEGKAVEIDSHSTNSTD